MNRQRSFNSFDRSNRVLPANSNVSLNYIEDSQESSSLTIDDYIINCMDSELCRIRRNTFQVIAHDDKIKSVAYSPCGRYLASCSKDKTVKVWNLEKNMEEFILHHHECVKSVCFSDDSSLLASGSKDGLLILWDMIENKMTEQKFSDPIYSICFLSDQSIALAIKSSIVISCTGNKEEKKLELHMQRVNSVSYSKLNNCLASGCENGNVKIFELENEIENNIYNSTAAITSVCFSNDGNLLAFGSKDHYVRIWKISKSQIIFNRSHSEKVLCVHFSFCGELLASGSNDKTAKIWNIKEKKEILTINHSEAVRSVHISHDGQLASGCSDKSVKVWNIKELLNQLSFIASHSKQIFAICFSFDGSLVASSSTDNSVIIWNIHEHKYFKSFEHSGSVYSICFSNNNKYLASGSKDKTLKVWDIDDGEEVFKGDHSDTVNSVSFCKDNIHLASASKDKSVIIWNIKLKKEEFRITGSRGFNSVCFSPVRYLLATGSQDQTLKVWEYKKKQEIFIENQQEIFIGNHLGKISSVCFSPDAKLLASASLDKTVKIWNVEKKCLALTLNHSDQVYSVSFSNDGNLLASGSKNRIVQVFNIKKKKKFIIGIHTKDVISVAFSPASNVLASGSLDGSLRVWNMKPNNRKYKVTHLKNITNLCFSSRSNYLASSSADNTVRVWSTTEKKIIFNEKYKDKINAICFSRDESLLASASHNQLVAIWCLKSEKIIHELTNDSAVYSISFSPDQSSLVSGSQEGQIKIFDVNSFHEIKKHNYDNEAILSLCFPRDANILAIGTDSSILIVNYPGCENKYQKISTKKVSSLCFSPDGRFFSSGSITNDVRVWDTENGKKVLNKSHFAKVNSVCFSPCGCFLASGSSDNKVKVWNINEKTEEFSGSHAKAVQSICFAFDSNFLASVSKDKTMIVWNIKEKRQELIALHSDIANLVCFSPDSYFLASASSDKKVRIWEIKNNSKRTERKYFDFMYISPNLAYFVKGNSYNKNIQVFYRSDFNKGSESFNISPMSFCVSNDGDVIAYETKDKTIELHYRQDNHLISIPQKLSKINSICLSDKCDYLAIATEEFIIYLWNIKEKKDANEHCFFKSHNSSISVMVFSPNNQNLVSGSYNGEIKLWSLIQKVEICSFKHEQMKIISINFRPKTVFMLSASGNSIKIWNTKDKIQEGELNHHKKNITSVSISRDGKLLASASIDNIIVIWSFYDKKYITIPTYTSTAICIRFSNSENIFVAGFRERPIKVWKFEIGNSNLDISNVQKNVDYPEDINQEESIIFDSFSEDEISNFSFIEEKTDQFFFEEEDYPKQENKIFLNNSAEFSKIYEHKIIQDSYGFEIINNKRDYIKKFKILDYKNNKLKLGIEKGISEHFLETQSINKIYKDLLNFQKRKKKFIEIDAEILPTKSLLFSKNLIRSIQRSNFSAYLLASEVIRRKNYQLVTKEECEIFISKYNFTIIHLASYIGNSEALEKILSKSKTIIIKADIFGKSPLFYSFMKKNLDCFDILLDYLIKIDDDDKDRLISSLNSTRNDFLLIIKSSTIKITEFLSKILITSEKKLEIPKAIRLPVIKKFRYIYPNFENFWNDFPKKKFRKYRVCTLKYTALKITSMPFSKDNIQALKTLYYCTNNKIFDDILIQYFIDDNWKAVFNWAFAYSGLIWIHIFFYRISFISTNNIYSIIPFLFTSIMIFTWEAFEMYNNFKEYFRNLWNWVDIALVIWTPFWSIFRLLEIDLLYSDLILSSILMVRGLASFKIFSGTRYYIQLILKSLDNIKYFMLIFIYSTIYFSILLYIILYNEKGIEVNYYNILQKTWSLSIIGDSDLDSQNGMVFILIIFSTVLNMILMLNMLISILGDSYDQFTLDKNSIDYKEKIYLAHEVQNTLFWKCKSNESSYIHVLENPLKNSSQIDGGWEGRIMYMEQVQLNHFENLNQILSDNKREINKKFSGVKKKIPELEKNINEKLFEVEKKIPELEKNFPELEKNINAKLVRLGKKIDEKVNDLNNNMKTQISEIINLLTPQK